MIARISAYYAKLRNYLLCRRLKSASNVFFHMPVGFVSGHQHIEIGKGTFFGKFAYLTAIESYEDQTFTPTIQIGEGCHFNDFCFITSIQKVVIGDGFLAGKWVTITDNSHGATDVDSLAIPPALRPLMSKGPVTIGKNVWVGDKATILPGVTIGDGAVVAANSVVTHDVEPYSVVAGSPAKYVRRNSSISQIQ